MDFEYIKNMLDIIPVKELKHHEQRIKPNLMRLKEAMLNIGQLVDPIIIDKKHKIVLDGNHRVKVLEMIKVPNVVCQVVDYESEKIQIGNWFPVHEKLEKELFEKHKIPIEPVDLEQGKKELENKKSAFMLVDKGKNAYLVGAGNYSLDEMIEEQQKILETVGNNFKYIADDRTNWELENGKGSLFRKIYTKDEIIQRAIEGKPFPPKSTRHLIPDRIIRLNMRIGWLHQERAEAWNYLERLLKNRVYAGNVRRYVEPVIVIY